jgi:hypothetical protein
VPGGHPVTRFGVVPGGHPGNQVADQNESLFVSSGSVGLSPVA